MRSGVVKRKNPNALTNLSKRLEELSKKEIAVGYPAGAAQAYPDGEKVAAVAARNTYGLGNTPQRDFMGLAKTLIKDDSQLGTVMREIAKQTNRPDGNPSVVESLMEAAGQRGQSLVQEAIRSGDWTPNAEETIEAKGSSKPLIDTSHMIQSTTYVIRDKK